MALNWRLSLINSGHFDLSGVTSQDSNCSHFRRENARKRCAQGQSRTVYTRIFSWSGFAAPSCTQRIRRRNSALSALGGTATNPASTGIVRGGRWDLAMARRERAKSPSQALASSVLHRPHRALTGGSEGGVAERPDHHPAGGNNQGSWAGVPGSAGAAAARAGSNARIVSGYSQQKIRQVP
jgi:hypothetical protein